MASRTDSGWVVAPVPGEMPWMRAGVRGVTYSCACVVPRGLAGSWTLGLELNRGAGTETREGVRSPRGRRGRWAQCLQGGPGSPAGPLDCRFHAHRVAVGSSVLVTTALQMLRGGERLPRIRRHVSALLRPFPPLLGIFSASPSTARLSSWGVLGEIKSSLALGQRVLILKGHSHSLS